MNKKNNIRNFSQQELKALFIEMGDKAFRAKQVYEWLWKRGVHSFDGMTNLSISTRDKLKENFKIPAVKIKTSQISSDRTIKNAFELYDGSVVEGVLIPATDRMTACISSQVGCSLTCKFCATGKMKRLRNIDFDEIYDQVVHIKNQAEQNYKTPLTNIVYMGMGEPLLNYKGLIKSVEKITSPDGLGMSPKRITVSTAGIAKMIKKLGDDEVKFNLAISLHAANDKKRDHIMPINEQNSLVALKESLLYFYEKTGTRITFEYIVFKDFNDGVEDAAELVSFCRDIPSKINIIEYNPIEDGEFKQTTPERLNAFVNHLEKNKLVVNVRKSRGKDIDAACGQLANKH
jgi:23S rRNA (adenine2503-C2)-methyltransferase